MALSLKSHFSELSLESNAFELLGISVLAYIWLRFSRKVVGCMGPFASGASKNVAGACLSQHFGQFLQKRHLLELSLESSAFGVLGIRVPACIWLRFSRKVVGCLGPFAWGASKNVAGACLYQVNLAIRSTEAENQTKMLFEIACQNFFRDRFRPDEQNYIGSVAGLGAIAPLEIRPLSLSGSAWAVSVSELWYSESTV